MKAIAEKYYFEPEIKIPNTFKVQTGDQSIDSLDFKRIIAKAMDSHSGYGWSVEQATEISELYRAFLFLCKLYPDEVIVPPRIVDDFWHLHILDTRNYQVDCDNIFGSYMHHFPYSGLKGTAVSSEQENEFIQKTLSLIKNQFPHLLEG